MKKILLALFLTVSLLFFATACSSNNTTVDEVTTDEDTVTTTTDDSALAEEIIGSWNNTSEEEGVGQISFTYTFDEDGTYTLSVKNLDESASDTDSKTGDHQVSGKYEIEGDQLILPSGDNLAVSDDTETSAEDVAEEVVNDTQEYTVAISGDELTMTDSLGDTIVYTRVDS